MQKELEEFARETMDLRGPDAWKVSMQSAFAAEQRGEYDLARGWRKIRDLPQTYPGRYRKRAIVISASTERRAREQTTNDNLSAGVWLSS
jgi:hypothetical protein